MSIQDRLVSHLAEVMHGSWCLASSHNRNHVNDWRGYAGTAVEVLYPPKEYQDSLINRYAKKLHEELTLANEEDQLDLIDDYLDRFRDDLLRHRTVTRRG